MNALTLSFLFFMSMPVIVLLIVVCRQRLELRAKRRRMRDLAHHGVRIECPVTKPALDLSRLPVSKSPLLKVSQDGGVILEALALCLCSWVLLGALWFVTTGIFSLSIAP